MINLAKQTFNSGDYNKETVIGEFSGRDSVAAILKAFESDDVNYILPVATFAGTEYGNFDGIYDNYVQLIKRVEVLYGNKKVLYPLIEYSRMDIWAIMCGRPMTMLVEKYGFVNPCIPCHLYFHLTKLKFAKPLSGRIISGERESHDGKVKLNQLDSSLDSYIDVIRSFDCELLMPIRHMTSGDEIEKLIGWDWEEGKSHPECVLSGNYRDGLGKAVSDEKKLEDYINGFIKPVGEEIGKFLLGEEEKSNENELKNLKEAVLDLI